MGKKEEASKRGHPSDGTSVGLGVGSNYTQAEAFNEEEGERGLNGELVRVKKEKREGERVVGAFFAHHVCCIWENESKIIQGGEGKVNAGKERGLIG